MYFFIDFKYLNIIIVYFGICNEILIYLFLVKIKLFIINKYTIK